MNLGITGCFVTVRFKLPHSFSEVKEAERVQTGSDLVTLRLTTHSSNLGVKY